MHQTPRHSGKQLLTDTVFTMAALAALLGGAGCSSRTPEADAATAAPPAVAVAPPPPTTGAVSAPPDLYVDDPKAMNRARRQGK